MKLTKGLKENAFGLVEERTKVVISTNFVPYDLKSFWGKKRKKSYWRSRKEGFFGFFGFFG